jgi:integrase
VSLREGSGQAILEFLVSNPNSEGGDEFALCRNYSVTLGCRVDVVDAIWMVPQARTSIRTKLHLERRLRDLALFNLAIDSKLRGCDLVALRVEDVAPNGYAIDRANVRQRKTGRPVRFELTEQTRESLNAYSCCSGRKAGQILFPAGARPRSTPHDAPVRALGGAMRGQRWSRPTEICHAFHASDERDVHLPSHGQLARLLGHTRIESSVRHLGVEVDDALEIAEKIDV